MFQADTLPSQPPRKPMYVYIGKHKGTVIDKGTDTIIIKIRSDQSLSRVQLFGTP